MLESRLERLKRSLARPKLFLMSLVYNFSNILFLSLYRNRRGGRNNLQASWSSFGQAGQGARLANDKEQKIAYGNRAQKVLLIK